MNLISFTILDLLGLNKKFLFKIHNILQKNLFFNFLIADPKIFLKLKLEKH